MNRIIKDITLREILSGTLKIAALALAYGILLGKVDQIDARLARVEQAFYSRVVVRQPIQPSLVPPAEAGTKP